MDMEEYLPREGLLSDKIEVLYINPDFSALIRVVELENTFHGCKFIVTTDQMGLKHTCLGNDRSETIETMRLAIDLYRGLAVPPPCFNS